MPSSRTRSTSAGSTRRSGLMEVLAGVPDPRDQRGVRHGLPMLLGLGIAAVIAGARSFAAIGEWVADQPPGALAELGVDDAARPEESAIRRLFARLDADVLDQVLGAWICTRTRLVKGRRVIAVDGKSVRGAKRPDGTMPHLVAAFDHTAGAVIGQIAVAAKSNEIPAVRDLLACFDLTGAVVTVDAMHTQTDTASGITAAGGDYLFTVKGNQPGLHARLKRLPWKDVPGHRTAVTGHGRRATRTIKVTTVPDWIDFPGAGQIAQLRRTVTTGGKKTVEVVYLITSASSQTAPPATLATWIQGHWGIENQLHWVRDVTYDEDRSQVRTGHAPRVMATVRNTAISLLRLDGWTNIAQALRHHARNVERPIALMLTC